MSQTLKRVQAALDHGMGRGSAQLRDEAHAACIMIVRECEATFRHITCLTGIPAKVQSSFLMCCMDFSAQFQQVFPRVSYPVLYR
jgi:hypothetical protein